MARFKLVGAFYADAIGVGRVKAGSTVADSVANALPGDVVWTGLNIQSLPQCFVPLDPSATTMRDASRWVNSPVPATILGADSVG
jgi:hypothetical protein